MEASGGSTAWQSFVQVNIGEQEPKTLEEINPHWRATCWLQIAVQGITDKEVPWYELVTPLTSGAEGTGRMTAHLLHLSSILVSLLLMKKWQEAWESHTGSWPTPTHCSRWERWPMGENGSGQGGGPGD